MTLKLATSGLLLALSDKIIILWKEFKITVSLWNRYMSSHSLDLQENLIDVYIDGLLGKCLCSRLCNEIVECNS